MKSRMSFRKILLLACTVIIVMLASAGPSAAQQLSGGIEGGITIGSVKIRNIPEQVGNVIRGDEIIGFEGGIFARLGFEPFYVTPHVLLKYRSGTVKTYQNDLVISDQHFTMEKLEVPLFVGLHLLGPVNVEAGPEYNYIISSTRDFNGTNINLRKGALGYRAGLRLTFDRIQVSGQYKGIVHKKQSGDNSATFSNPYELIFGIAIRLGGEDASTGK